MKITAAQNLRALMASARHWHRHATNKAKWGEDVFADSCALCKLHLDDGCERCPIKMKTGLGLCGGSPWRKAERAYKLSKVKQPPRFLRCAAVMRDFIIDLLPKREQAKLRKALKL